MISKFCNSVQITLKQIQQNHHHPPHPSPAENPTATALLQKSKCSSVITLIFPSSSLTCNSVMEGGRRGKRTPDFHPSLQVAISQMPWEERRKVAAFLNGRNSLSCLKVCYCHYSIRFKVLSLSGIFLNCPWVLESATEK